MAMVDVDSKPTSGLTGQVSWLGLMVGVHLALSLQSSIEAGELLRWPRHDDSVINSVIGVIRLHRSTMYVDAACCYGPSSVVCLSVML